MKRFIRLLALVVTCLALAVPQLDAQHTNTNRGRGGGGGGSRSTTTQQSRPSNQNRGNRNNQSRGRTPNRQPSHNSGSGNYRPGTGNNKNNGQATRPGNNHGSSGNYRPGGTTNNGNNHGSSNNYRPGGTTNNGNNHRPGNGDNGYRPGGNNHRPGHGAGLHPGGPRPPMMRPPVRPHRPVIRHPWRPPVPPPHWHPRPHAPLISSILGITFGTAIGLSIDMLVSSGYYVDGYSSNAVYLRDVREYNYMWPDATFYYGANGGLARSEFLYSTPYPDPMRYNSLYNTFVAAYGAPVSIVNGAPTWFAPNRGYITLQYGQQQSLGGQLRFFTTLTFGL